MTEYRIKEAVKIDVTEFGALYIAGKLVGHIPVDAFEPIPTPLDELPVHTIIETAQDSYWKRGNNCWVAAYESNAYSNIDIVEPYTIVSSPVAVKDKPDDRPYDEYDGKRYYHDTKYRDRDGDTWIREPTGWCMCSSDCHSECCVREIDRAHEMFGPMTAVED